MFARQRRGFWFAAAAAAAGMFLCCWGSDNGIGGAFEERRLANAGLGNNKCGTDGRSGSCDTVTMPDGKMWLAENLNYKTDNSWCYDGKESNCKKYGRLYTWEAAKAACDALGWHLPSYNEWIDLIGTNTSNARALKARSGWGSKESINYGTYYYGFPDGNGTDDYGFSALPGGYRDGNGVFSYAGYDGHWWTARGVNELEATVFGMDNSDYMAERWGLDKKEGRSARCVKGTNPNTVVKGTFTDDRNGQTYKTVQIGGKTWMAENLNYYTSGSWCYDNKTSYCEKYGRLYDWNTARTVCPAGWHLSSRQDWHSLGLAIDAEKLERGYGTVDWIGAGMMLNAASGWPPCEYCNYTDSYGFSALPGGYSEYGIVFDTAGKYGYWWTAAEYYDGKAYCYVMYPEGNLFEFYESMADGYSVRCVKD
jgi:uncharacterized protein (TIGR02145 family)